MIGALFLLLLVKIPGIGFAAGGASRWIHVGPVFFQPSEFMKLAVVIYVSAWLVTRNNFQEFWKSLGPMLSLVSLGLLLILWQPDFGTMIALLGIVFVLLVAGGVPWKWILGMGATGLAMLGLLIRLEPYRFARVLTFLDPGKDPQGAGYQILQSLLAVGSGGFWGLGYGLSRQKYNYLPEVLGDSMFAVVAEELGFFRVIIILVIFLLFLLRGLQVASKTSDVFGRLLATGVVAMFMVQVVVNIGATLGLLPLTGIPLPFFSYGSSAFIVNLSSLGLLLNISNVANKA
jgi:cell division protein FtsW